MLFSFRIPSDDDFRIGFPSGSAFEVEAAHGTTKLDQRVSEGRTNLDEFCRHRIFAWTGALKSMVTSTEIRNFLTLR